jgi:hypothetical protein
MHTSPNMPGPFQTASTHTPRCMAPGWSTRTFLSTTKQPRSRLGRQRARTQLQLLRKLGERVNVRVTGKTWPPVREPFPIRLVEPAPSFSPPAAAFADRPKLQLPRCLSPVRRTRRHRKSRVRRREVTGSQLPSRHWPVQKPWARSGATSRVHQGGRTPRLARRPTLQATQSEDRRTNNWPNSRSCRVAGADDAHTTLRI